MFRKLSIWLSTLENRFPYIFKDIFEKDKTKTKSSLNKAFHHQVKTIKSRTFTHHALYYTFRKRNVGPIRTAKYGRTYLI